LGDAGRTQRAAYRQSSFHFVWNTLVTGRHLLAAIRKRGFPRKSKSILSRPSVVNALGTTRTVENETRKNPSLLLKWFCSRRLKREGGKSEESGKRKQAKSGRKSSARIRGGASAPPHQSGRVPKKPRCSRRHAGTFRCGEGHHRKCCRKKSNNNNSPGHIIRLASVYDDVRWRRC
jgi:hypothetical protein